MIKEDASNWALGRDSDHVPKHQQKVRPGMHTALWVLEAVLVGR